MRNGWGRLVEDILCDIIAFEHHFDEVDEKDETLRVNLAHLLLKLSQVSIHVAFHSNCLKCHVIVSDKIDCLNTILHLLWTRSILLLGLQLRDAEDPLESLLSQRVIDLEELGNLPGSLDHDVVLCLRDSL